MRRALSFATVFALVVAIAMTALAASYGTYRDEFRKPGYSGSVGTLDWSNDPWREIEDDGSPASGAVHVDPEGLCAGSSCLHIFSKDGELSGVGAKRHADTSMFSWFEFCYEVTFQGDDELTDAILVVEKSVDGGDVWYQLDAYELYNGFQLHPTHEIGEYDSMTFRFLVHGQMVGEVFIDDIEIKGEVGVSGTTTSTSTTSTTIDKSTATTATIRATTTTTDRPDETTTTTEATTTTSPDQPRISTTTTTISDTTSTTEAFVITANDDPPLGPPGPPEGSGIREAARGIQASFDGDLYGDVEAGSLSINGVDHEVDYRMATEMIKASWVWLVVLALVVAWSIVSGLERRRSVAGA